MRRHAITTVAFVLAMATALAGCSTFGPERPIPSATVEFVDVPAGMLLQEPAVALSSRIVPASANHPWLIGGSTRAVGDVWKPSYWSSRDGTKWLQHVIPGVDGDFVGTFQGSDELVAIGGVVWRDGVRRSRLWTSRDGVDWREIALPSNFGDQFRIEALTVSEQILVAIGLDDAGAGRGIRVVGNSVSEFAVPETGGEPLGVLAVALHGDRMVLLARPGPDGEPAQVGAFVSSDRGASWGGFSAVADAFDHIAGLAVVDDGFVATGGAVQPDGDRDAAAWFSADGRVWERETVPASSRGWLNQDRGNLDLGAPNAAAGVIGAMLRHPSSLVNEAFRRSSEGVWEPIAASDLSADTGQYGAVVHAWSMSVGLIAGHGGARLGTITDSKWVTTTTLSTREDLMRPISADMIGSELVVESRQVEFTATAEHWSRRSHSSYYTINANALVEAVPTAPADIVAPKRAQNGESALVLGGHPTDVAAQGWFRSDLESGWIGAVGLPSDRWASINDVAFMGDQWIAIGNVRDSFSLSDLETAASWVSGDGVHWTEASPPSPVGLESRMSSVCALPDGTPIAIGEAEYETNRFRAAVWTLNDGAWRPNDGGILTEYDGHAAECVSTEHGVLVRAGVKGRVSLYLGTDANTWTEVMRPDRGSWIAGPVDVDGGFAATGYYRQSTFTGPVVWLSRDGMQWNAVSVPAVRDTGVGSVAAMGEDMVVLMSGANAHPVMIIRDIADLIDATAP